MLSWSDDAGDTLQDVIDGMGRAKQVCRATFADGDTKDVEVQPTPVGDGMGRAGGWYGRAFVRDWSDAADAAVGEPYWIDLYSDQESEARHVTDLYVY